ncbi:hypothetical protein Tco_1021683 [Tanacetum coccineum]
MMLKTQKCRAGTVTSYQVEENDYESWKIRLDQITDPVPDNSPAGTVMQPRNKTDEEFDAADTLKEQCDIQASNILSQGLPRRIFNTLNQNESAKEIWDSVTKLVIPIHSYEHHKFVNNLPSYGVNCANVKNAKDMSTVSYVDLFTYLRSYEEHAMKTLRKQEQSSSVADPLTYLVKTTLQLSHDAAMLATMQQIANLLSGFQKQFPPTNNQLRSSSNTRSQATVHDGQITTKIVQRRALGNVGNTGSRGNQNNGQGVNNQRKAMLLQAKEKGVVLDAEAEAFLADVEYTIPLVEPFALSTTNMFQVSHEDAYDSDVDDEPNAIAAFMANLSSNSNVPIEASPDPPSAIPPSAATVTSENFRIFR